ncbi:MAG: RNA polymerase sigma factor [Candidatus Dormiibacterota bacterium]
MFNVLVDVTGTPRAPIEAEMEDLVRVESRRLYSIAFSILQDASEAEDAVQETLISAWRSWPWAAGTSPTPSWLTRVCVNQCLNRRRTRLRQMRLAESAANREPWQDVRPATDLDLARAYARLSRQQRAAVALHYFYGYTLDECAELLGNRPGTVRSHIARALVTLRRAVSP